MTHPDPGGVWHPQQSQHPPAEPTGKPGPAHPLAAQQPRSTNAARAAVQAQPAPPPASAPPRPRRQAAPQPPPDPNPDPPGSPPPDSHPERTGPSGRTTRLHIGWHSLPRGAPPFRVTTAHAGLLLGRNHPVRILTPDPFGIALVGGLWAAQLLIFRAFALGARVIVVTSDPRSWSGFGERATGQYNRLTVLSSDQGGFPAGTSQMPTLSVYDLGTAAPTTPPTPGPWHTRLTLLRHLDRAGLPTLQSAHLVLLQRLTGDEPGLAASALRLPAADTRPLESLADDMIAVFHGGADDYVPLSTTPIERQLLGAPRR